jgi:hypothetical protein
MNGLVRFALACCLVVAMARPAVSQSRNTGEIRGTVADMTGAVLPGAVVTLTNIDTGETKEFVTNADGIYDTVSTPAGNYNISFTVKGFKKLVRGPFTLNVDVITENAALDIGAITETVTVEGNGVPLLDTETSHMGTVLEKETIGKLPQVGAGITGNDWANFNILLPGAAGAPSQPASEGSGAYNAGDAISINGNLPNYANYLADGAVVQLPVSNNVDNTVFEAVSEVQITTSSFSAEYGIGGAVFNQISKSGTNGFHGSVYDYWQNDMLDASQFFNVQQSNGSFVKPPPAYLRYNEWGGSVGGPILKNKLFFYFVRDKIYNNGAGSVHVSTVPTLAERGMGSANPGEFDFSGNPTIYNPATRTTVGGPATAFPGNIIPANMVDPVAAKLLASYPLPNATGSAATVNGVVYPGDIQNNFTFTSSAPNPNLRYFGRIDYDYSSKNRVSFSISQKNNNGQNINQLPCPLNCFSGDIDGYNVQLSDTWQISSTLVNEFRMGYTKQGNWFVPQTLGFDSASSLGLQYAKAAVFPTINVNGVCCTQLAPGTNAVYIENLYDPSDVITLVKGRHILHFGIEVLMGEGNTTPWGNITAGNFSFTGQYTQQNGVTGTGAGLADFLLGDVENWGATNQSTSYARLKSPQAFVQDDIKLRPNFTLNLGLRYVGTTGFSETKNSLGGFDPNLINPSNGTLGSMWFAGQDNRNTLQKGVWDIFLPRVGFAWSIRPNTVIRGGFGMYSYNFSQDTYGNGIGTGALTTSTGNTTDPNAGTGPTPLINLDASAATANSVLTYVVGSPAAREPLTYCCKAGVFSNETYVPYNVQPGRINEWQLSAEHQFAGNFMASVAYVGSHGSNLQFPTDLNQVTNPADMVAGNQALRPFPSWGSLGGNFYDGISNYTAAQATITKRYTNGLLFSFNYVWSHFLDDQDSSGWGSRGGTQAWQIGNNPAANYANSNFDIPNAVKGYVAYDLPFGKGRKYMSGTTAPVDAAIGGWQISGTMVIQSGNPFTITNNVNNSFSDCGNGCSWFPNLVGSPNAGVPASPVNSISWFNTAAYASATSGTFGNNGRNTLRGPYLNVFNMSLAKTINIKERVQLQLRSDWVNIFNHPSFGPPSSTLGAGNFGLINSSAPNGGIAVAPRTGQLSARITF